MAKKQQSRISAEAVRRHRDQRRLRFGALTPDKMVALLEDFDRGYLRDTVALWDRIKERDDAVLPVAQKRELSVALLDWEIQMVDDSPEAEKHKAALEEFYNSLRCTNAADENERGGVAHLLRQMMTAIGHRYSVHEIVWDPSPGALSAEFRFVPLSFFENRSGKLRFLADGYGMTGDDLEEGGWLVTTGAGVMKATSIAYLFKQMPLRSWVSFCEKAGIPGLHGKTNAAKGSEEWNVLVEAVTNFVSDWALVTSESANITPLDLRGNGNAPHPALVDRMDRAISRIWLGGDLGTMSAPDAVGANPQAEQAAILEAADALTLSEALQEYVDRKVIEFRFGTTPLAYFQLQPRSRIDLAQQIQVDDALVRWGVPRSKKDLAAFYGRPLPEEGEEVATVPAPSPTPFANETSAGRRVVAASEAASQAKAIERALNPLRQRLNDIAEQPTPEARRQALEALRAELPQLYSTVLQTAPAATRAFEKIIGQAFSAGFAASHAQP